jgi:hypothetical protein
MKNRFWQIIGGTFLGLLMLGGAAHVLVTAQENEKRERSLEGTWLTSITQRNCQTGAPLRTFKGVLTFNKGGTMVGDSTAFGPALKTASYGVWEREKGSQNYSFAFVIYRFNPDGTLAGSQVVRQNLQLGESGNDFTTTGTLEVLDVDGNVLTTGCATSTGTRFE